MKATVCTFVLPPSQCRTLWEFLELLRPEFSVFVHQSDPTTQLDSSQSSSTLTQNSSELPHTETDNIKLEETTDLPFFTLLRLSRRDTNRSFGSGEMKSAKSGLPIFSSSGLTRRVKRSWLLQDLKKSIFYQESPEILS